MRYSKIVRLVRCDACGCILGGTKGQHRVAGVDGPWCLCGSCRARYEPSIRAEARAAIRRQAVAYKEGGVK